MKITNKGCAVGIKHEYLLNYFRLFLQLFFLKNFAFIIASEKYMLKMLRCVGN